MREIGLKLFSTNKEYCESAMQLYSQGVFDFIELYVVPDSYKQFCDYWRRINIPFVIHASHCGHGVNLAQKEFWEHNQCRYNEASRFADELNAKYIIFHPGINGRIEETARQIKALADHRIVVENKPYHTIYDKELICNGYSIEEISYVLNESGCGFCLDVGHCFCAANSTGQDKIDLFKKFLLLSPLLVHISDNDDSSSFDGHLHLGSGNYDLCTVLSCIPEDVLITVETNKDSLASLDDFIKDVDYLKDLEKKSRIVHEN